MEYYFYEEPVTFAIIKNFYESDEIEEIHQELERLRPFMGGPEKTGTARGVSGVSKKDNHGLFLDEFYQARRDQSVILKLNRKVFSPGVKHDLTKGHWFFKYIDRTEHDSTLVSYYRQGDYYKAHEDESFLTAIYYTWKEPKNFEGGDLYFGDFQVPIENNCLLIFPSVTKHRVTEVTRGDGRYAISQFVSLSKPPIKMPEIDSYQNVLDVSEFQKVASLATQKWDYTGRSKDGGNKFWYLDLSFDPFYTKHIKEKIEKLVNGKLILDRVYANGQTCGQDGEFHQDSLEPGTYTFILYTNIIEGAIESWGGETQFKFPHFMRSYFPIPNSGLFFNSNLLHRGFGPAHHVKDMRVTVAWKFKVQP